MTEKEYLKHAKLMWKSLVPNHGHAATYNGELVRSIENLRDEAQQNGNKNWDKRHSFKANFIQKTLVDSGIFSPEIVSEIKKDIDTILNYNFPETSDTIYDRLLNRIVDWDLKNPQRLELSNEFLIELAEHDDSAFEGLAQRETEESPLARAILVQDAEKVKSLIKAGADIEEKDKFGGTLLGGAAAVGNLEIIELLIRAGANINHVDSIGQSVLDMSKYRPEAKKLLKSKGAKSGKQLKKTGYNKK